MQDLLQGPNNKPAWSNLNALSLNCDSLTCTTINTASIPTNYILVTATKALATNAASFNVVFTKVLGNGLVLNPSSGATGSNQNISGFVNGKAYAVKYFLNIAGAIAAGNTISINALYGAQNISAGASNLFIGSDVNVELNSFLVVSNPATTFLLNQTTQIAISSANIGNGDIQLYVYIYQLN